jgi:glyoxylase-like metal-dependent hydrolase (beta-lactamase superfamily II)
MKIIENVYVVPGVNANPYILNDADGLTIIDAGLPGSENKILDYVTNLGKSAHDVKRIIITHADLDHTGGLVALKKATDARTYASKVEAEAIASGKPSRPIKRTKFSLQRFLHTLKHPPMKPVRFQVDEILVDGQILPVLGGLRVVATIGHTPGHVSLFAPADGILFCGDSMVCDASGNILGSRPQFTWDEALAREAEKIQAALGANIVCSGHGPVVVNASGKFPV